MGATHSSKSRTARHEEPTLTQTEVQKLLDAQRRLYERKCQEYVDKAKHAAPNLQVQQPSHTPQAQQPNNSSQVQQPKHSTQVQQPSHTPQAQQPNNSSQVQQPKHSTQVQQPSHTPQAQQPNNSSQVQQPKHSTQVQQPSHTPQAQQPNNSSQVQQPKHSTQVQQPTPRPQVQQPSHTPQAQQPNNSSQVQQPKHSTQVQQPTPRPQVQQSSYTPQVKQPNNLSQVQLPKHLTQVQQPTPRPQVQQPSHTPLAQQPNNSSQVQQPKHLKQVQQPTPRPQVQQPNNSSQVQQSTHTLQVQQPTQLSQMMQVKNLTQAHARIQPSEPAPFPSGSDHSIARCSKATDSDKLNCSTCKTDFDFQIYMCNNYHNSCSTCKKFRRPCGICDSHITYKRNIGLERYMAKKKVPCPYMYDGCKLFIKMSGIEYHVKECPFKELQCPLACGWKGKLKQLPGHFDDMHPDQRAGKMGTEVRIQDIFNDSQNTFLVLVDGFKFLFHVKISAQDRKIYMTAQLIGTKISAFKWSYEVHVYNKNKCHSKYVFADACTSNIEPVTNIFKEGRCSMLTHAYASTFIVNGALHYKFFIRQNSNAANILHGWRSGLSGRLAA